MTGEEMRTLRKTLNLTQAEMANEMGLSLRAYTDSEGSEGEVRQLHAMAATLISLRQAVEQKRIDLALPEVRGLALDLVTLIRPEA